MRFQFSGVFPLRVPLEVITETRLFLGIHPSESPDGFELGTGLTHNPSEFRLYGFSLPGRCNGRTHLISTEIVVLRSNLEDLRHRYSLSLVFLSSRFHSCWTTTHRTNSSPTLQGDIVILGWGYSRPPLAAQY